MKQDGTKERFRDDGSCEGDGEQGGQSPREIANLSGAQEDSERRGEEAMGRSGQGCVYFIETHDGAFVKIGYSIDLPQRFDQLGVMMPGLRLIGYVPGTRRMEGRLHRRFDAHRERGEWFRQASEIREFLRAEATALNLTMPLSRQRKPDSAKNAVAQAMVAMRNKKLSPARRKEIASDAAKKRWADRDKAVSTSSKPTMERS